MTKKILISGLVGTLVYGIILTESTTGEESMLFIFLGCLFFSFIFSYVFVSLTAISQFKEGFSAGLVIGLLYVLSWYFFMNMEFDLNEFLQEVVIGTLMTAIVAGVVAFVNGKID